MALKFLNKKGWHTGSLRNIENVWKAEQKHEAEQKKLEELRKQIQEERERSEFRLLQEQAGLVTRQERLEFLYDSGLAVGKGSSSSAKESGVAFKTLEEAVPATINKTSDLSSSSSAVPGALFEDKPHSANDAWRKLHSDPLLLIRQQEQEALSRIKNNPVQMALIRKSVETNKKEKSESKKDSRKKHKHHKHSSYSEQLNSEDVHDERNDTKKSSSHKRSKYDDDYKARFGSDNNSRGRERKINSYRGSSHRDQSPSLSDLEDSKSGGHDAIRKDRDKFKYEKRMVEDHTDGHKREKEFRSFTSKSERNIRSVNDARSARSSAAIHHESHHKLRNVASKLSEEERAAKLQAMQADAELYEEQRWKRLKKAEADDAQEAAHGSISGGRNFLDATQRSVYGTGKGGSSTIEESVRRRVHYSQGKSEAGDGNAFRR